MGLSVGNAGQDTASLIDNAQLTNTAFTGFVLSIFFFTMFVVILPGLSLVLTERRQVFDVFTMVPPSIIIAVRNRVANNILAKKATGEAEGTNGDDTLAQNNGNVITEAVNISARNEETAEQTRMDRRHSSKRQHCCHSLRRMNSSKKSALSASSAASEFPIYRSFRNNYSGRARIFLILLSPVLIFCVFYAVIFVSERDEISLITVGRSQVLAASELRSLVQSIALHTRYAVTSVSREFVSQELTYAERDAAALSVKIDVFAYGDSETGFPSALASSESAHTLLVINGCVDNTVSDEECANYGPGQPCVYYYQESLCKKVASSVDTGTPIFDFGVVGTGLLPAVREYLKDIGDLLRVRRDELDVLPFTVGASLDTGAGAIVDQMGASYLVAGFGELLIQMRGETMASIRYFKSWNLASISSVSIALILVYILVYAPILTNLDEEIKRTRFLLLLFPEDVAKRVPAVGSAARSYYNGQGGTSGKKR